MNLHLDPNSAGDNHITYYDKQKLVINNNEYRQNCIIFPDEILLDWSHHDVSTIRCIDFDPIIAKQPELIILGTGVKLIFPSADTIAHVQSNTIGLEVMDTGAACRSYNLLSAEKRYIAAIIMFAAR